MSEVDDMLAETAGRIFAAAKSESGAFDSATWAATVDAGLDRLLLSEDAGGLGDAFEVAATVATVFGKHAVAVPLVETLVANWCLERAGLDVSADPKSLYVALPVENSRSGRPAQGGLLGAAPGTRIVVVTPDGAERVRVALFAGLSAAGAAKTNLAGEPAMVARPDRFEGSPESSGVAKLTSDSVLAVLATLKAAAIVGTLETALAMSIDYTNSRKQFGRRIGAFQAVQHMIARMAEETAAAAAAARKAARSLGQPNGLFAAAVAKARAGDAAYPVAAMAHQCHGAIGFTRECALHRFTTRMLAWRDEAGDADYWHGRIGAAALGLGSAGLWASITEGSLL